MIRCIWPRRQQEDLDILAEPLDCTNMLAERELDSERSSQAVTEELLFVVQESDIQRSNGDDMQGTAAEQ